MHICTRRAHGDMTVAAIWNSAAALLRGPSSNRAIGRFRRDALFRAEVIIGALSPRPAEPTHPTSRGLSPDFVSTYVSTNISTNIVLPNTPSCALEANGLKSIWDSILLWAVPKKRTSHSKKRMRMTHKYLKPKNNYKTCPQCGNLKLPHMLCGHCFRETMKSTAEFRRQKLEEKVLGKLDTVEEHDKSYHSHPVTIS